MVSLQVWIDDRVVYHSKIGQKATLSLMNKLVSIEKGFLLLKSGVSLKSEKFI